MHGETVKFIINILRSSSCYLKNVQSFKHLHSEKSRLQFSLEDYNVKDLTVVSIICAIRSYWFMQDTSEEITYGVKNG